MQAMNDSAQPESTYAWLRLWTSLALMTLGGVAMYGVVVVLPAVQSEFGVTREELIELITHLAIYSGWPNAGTAALIAKEVFAERKP